MGWLVDAIGFLVRGGPVMAPLIVCSVVSVAVTVERWMAVRAALADTSDLWQKVEDFVRCGEADKALALCEAEAGPVAAVLAAGIANRKLGTEGAERAMVDRASAETRALTVRLSWLDTIITIAPLLGLLGTVTGMIRSFHVISSREGISTPTAITGGVAEALIATATGLAIAIFTLVCYNALNEKVKMVTAKMESVGTQFLNLLIDSRERANNEITVLSA